MAYKYERPLNKPFIRKLSEPDVVYVPLFTGLHAFRYEYWWQLICPKCDGKYVFCTWEKAIEFVVNY